MKNLTKKAKIALGSAVAGVLALAVALGIWQPWVKPEEPVDEPNELQGEVLPPAGEEEEKLTLNVGGEKIPCVIFEGAGWKIYVPEDWETDAGENGGKFLAPGDEAQAPRVEVIRSSAAIHSGSFVIAAPQQLSDTEQWTLRTFYAGTEEGGWEVVCQAPEETWDDYQKLMTAMVRTMTVEEEKIFSGLSPVASEPDWQIMDGDTLLWMDKDAYVVDDEVKKFVEGEMMAWDSEAKVNFTGQYRMEDLTWAGSYTCLPDRAYVDVFRTIVRYEVAEGKEENILLGGSMSIQDGWLYEGFPLYAAVYHDGSAVEEVRLMYTNLTDPSQAQFVVDNLLDNAE